VSSACSFGWMLCSGLAGIGWRKAGVSEGLFGDTGWLTMRGPLPPVFLQMHILKGFKSCVLKLRILKGLRALFAKVRILLGLRVK
jgi:hypothetical protein